MFKRPISFKEYVDEEPQVEALDFAARRALGRAMKKNKAKLAIGRRRALKKAASQEVLKKRARKGAINALFKKLSKGKSRSSIPASRKKEIEKRISKMGSKVSMIARKSLPQIRAMEKERRRTSKK